MLSLPLRSVPDLTNISILRLLSPYYASKLESSCEQAYEGRLCGTH